MIKIVILKINKFFKSNWKKLLIALIIIMLVLGGIQYSNAQKVKNQPTVAKAIKKDIVQTVSASGKIKADEEVTLKFQTSGQLAWVGVKKGDKVSKWQAIASLDRQELEKKLKQELLDYMNERWDLEQTRADYADKSYDASTLETIRRTKDQSQFDMDRTVLDVEIANIALKYSTLITPIEGIVTLIDTPFAGINVTPTTAEFVVSNPEKLIFSANVDETDIGKIKSGQKAKFTLDAYADESFESSIDQVEFTPTTTSGGGTAFAVKFSLPPNINEKFKIGMNGDVDIIISQKNQVLVVPEQAIREQNGDKYVWILENKKPVKKTVKIGFSDSDFNIEIIDGLEENDEVITSGFKNLK